MESILVLCLPFLIQLESGGDPNAVGKHDDVGILQITPIMVRECNRINGLRKVKTRYTLKDRWDVEKSIEMYRIYMRWWCPRSMFFRGMSTEDKLAMMGRLWQGGPKGHLKKCTLKRAKQMRQLYREHLKQKSITKGRRTAQRRPLLSVGPFGIDGDCQRNYYTL